MLYREKTHNPLTGEMEWMAVAETAEDLDYMFSEEWIARGREIGAEAAILELPTKKEES
jgi:hypothetical protein